jgi:16S rRNA (guanine527-N7)-methyltransferase
LPSVCAEEVEQYEAYFALLREWNEKINLVSRKSIETSFAFHFADSVWIAEYAHAHLEGRSSRDLGSGAGFPGIVSAIRYPKQPITLYEKLAKRRIFLQDVIDKLSLKNVRLEGALPERCFSDLFTARAVFPLEELFPFMKRHFLPGGRLAVSLGGGREIPQDVPKPFEITARFHYELPEGAGGRQLVIYSYVPRGTREG